jgi:hypothetical protein
MDAAGNFAVAWGNPQQGIYVRLFDAGGVAQGPQFLASTTTGTFRLPTLAMDADGDFVVCWTNSDSAKFGVYAQRFNAAGVPQGDEFRPSTARIYMPSSSVAMDRAGDFVIAYMTETTVYLQRYDAAGKNAQAELQVTRVTGFIDPPVRPGIAMDADGDFVLGWSSTDATGSFDAYAQRFTRVRQGIALGTAITTASTDSNTTNDQDAVEHDEPDAPVAAPASDVWGRPPVPIPVWSTVPVVPGGSPTDTDLGTLSPVSESALLLQEYGEDVFAE